MKRLFLLPLLLAPVSCEVLPVYSDPITAFHGKSQLDVITAARQIDSFRLDPYSYGTRERGERFAGYLVVRRGPLLNERQQLELVPLFLDERHYGFDFSKGCEFMPGVGFRFLKDGKRVDMLICFKCNEWQFEHDGRVVGEDFHRRIVRPKLARIARELFPDDIVLRNLRNIED